MQGNCLLYSLECITFQQEWLIGLYIKPSDCCVTVILSGVRVLNGCECIYTSLQKIVGLLVNLFKIFSIKFHSNVFSIWLP